MWQRLDRYDSHCEIDQTETVYFATSTRPMQLTLWQRLDQKGSYCKIDLTETTHTVKSTRLMLLTLWRRLDRQDIHWDNVLTDTSYNVKSEIPVRLTLWHGLDCDASFVALSKWIHVTSGIPKLFALRHRLDRNGSLCDIDYIDMAYIVTSAISIWLTLWHWKEWYDFFLHRQDQFGLLCYID